ncbi:MAG TPA: AraC family transcriptional regulator [Puia sp.]|jgi:AraC-like DNA-binding protein|nr:AraC family transcriptional regulator [Puia sp.]
MLYRFPPAPAEATDPSFLTGETETFAKLKIESKTGKRTVLMTEHTLIFVMKGIKLLHFPGETLRVSSREVILLRKGIYVMAEYIEEGLDFEAMMLFLPVKLLRALETTNLAVNKKLNEPCLIFPMTAMIEGFKESLRKYFENRPNNYEALLPLKQKEILLLLLSGSYGERVQEFIHAAVSTEPTDISFIVNNYLLQPVSIAELANLANCSLATFKRSFQQQYQSSPRVWINEQRLRHACLLLRNTRKPVAEVAMDCGFESVSYFIRLFKKEHGCTPTELRAKSAIE